MKMKTLKEGIITHADSLGELFKFSAEHTCRSILHSLEEFANWELVTFKVLTAGFFLALNTICGLRDVHVILRRVISERCGLFVEKQKRRKS